MFVKIEPTCQISQISTCKLEVNWLVGCVLKGVVIGVDTHKWHISTHPKSDLNSPYNK